MAIKRSVLTIVGVLVLILGTNAFAQAQGFGTNPVVFAQGELTTAHRAVFAQFLAVIPNEDPEFSVNSAMSISNVCAAPDVLSPFLGREPTEGRVALYLYDMSGNLTTFIPDSDMLGAGLNPDGTLKPGQTWTVNLSEVLTAAIGSKGNEFRGYGWVLSEFDCLGGTYSNTIYGLGFTQNFEMLPAMGQGG
ncbi:MAG TPA: hypothetical protein VMY18_07110, partial [Acidobacteriota bacterium]|nr:hypothetical protein [Acidobacteriota bacterium]